MKRWLLIFALAAPLMAQNTRWDLPITTVQAQGGNLLPVYAIPGAGIKFYSCSGSVCTTLATTYISATSGTTCPVSPTPMQVTLNGSSTCVSTADPYGNMGAWFQAGQYMATITAQGGSYNYYFTVGSGGSGSGCSPNTIPNGCTGATTVLGANGNLGVPGPVVNVIGSGAKGDCVTDDQTAINAALRLADTYAVNGSLPAEVYFPNPPGGCYKTSKMLWYGESLAGPPPGQSGTSSGKGGVIIQGMPEQDILGPPDPTTTNYPFYYPRTIQNIVFKTDDSVAPNFPHRWPGRWVDDISMTSGSAVVSSSRASFTCGDVGQAILVTGAGAGGSNLSTTVSSVSPCWSFENPTNGGWQTVTLAATASTSVTNAHTYISVGNLPVTAHVGNAAIAFDDEDGNSADWVNTSGTISNYGMNLWNVTFTSTSQTALGQNSSASIYTQGVWGLYKIDARNVDVNRLVYGPIQATSELNAYNGSAAQDQEVWDHMGFDYTEYPWISYDGGKNKLLNWEMTTAFGPQVLSEIFQSQTTTGNWYIDTPEFENNTGAIGWQLTGSGHQGNQMAFGGTGQSAYIETTNFRCANCGFGNGTTYVDGEHNIIDVAASGIQGATISNRGRANQVVACTAGQYTNAMPTDSCAPAYFQKGSGTAGEQTADFLSAPATPWSNNNDLFLTPQDASFNGSTIGPPYFVYSNFVITDAVSLTGQDIVFSPGQAVYQFSQFASTVPNGNNSSEMVIGTNVPATSVTVSLSAKCGSSTTFDFQLIAQNGSGNTTIDTQTLACTTAFATYSFNENLSSYATKWLVFYNSGSVTANISWIGINPFAGSLNSTGPVNGSQIQVSGNQVATGNLGDWTDSGVANGNCPVWNSVTSKWTPGTCGTGFANPMTTLGDVIYGGASGVATRLAGSISASTLCLTQTGTGSVSAAPVWGSCAGSAATAFSAITGSTNNSGQALVVGSTSSMDFSGTGTIDSNLVNGAVVPASAGFVASNSSRQLIAAAYTPTNAAVVPSTTPSAGQILVGNAGGTAYAPVTASGSCTLASTGAFTCSGSGLSGMTTGQVPIAASASTVTSSKALAGAGAAIVTGPASSTSNDAVTFTGTGGQIQDAGFAPAPAVACTTVSSLSPASNGCYNLSTSSSVAMPAASAFTIFTVSTETGATATFTSTTLTSNSNCSGYLSGTTLALTANQTIVVKSDGTNVWAGCSTAAGTGTVTSVATTGPITGGTITGSGTIACATCVAASSPGAGIAHFAGSTQTVTSSAVSLTADVSGVLPLANMTQLFQTNAQTATYQVLAADFADCKVIPVASGTFNITLVASGSQPAAGQCIRVLNYGSGVVSVVASGQNINGVSTTQTLAAGSASAPTGLLVSSDGTNYFAQPLVASSGGGGCSNNCTISTTAIGTVPLTINGFSSGQTADLLDIYDYAGHTKVAYVDKSGNSSASGNSFANALYSSTGNFESSNSLGGGIILNSSGGFIPANNAAAIQTGSALYQNPLSNNISIFLTTMQVKNLSGAGTITGSWSGDNIAPVFGSGSNETYNGALPIMNIKSAPTININTASTSGYAEIYSQPVETSVGAGVKNYFIYHNDSGGTLRYAVTQNGAVLNGSSQTTVSCSTSGSAIFSQPEQGASDKKVLIHLAACLGTASYTYPTAFTNTPSVYASNNVVASIASSVSTSAVTVTGTTSTGSLILEDY